MALHLIKLCVGCSSPEELQDWIDLRLEQKRLSGEVVEQYHTTRMVPKRVEDLIPGGSIYWVMKGNVQCRQRLLEIRPFKDNEGISRCRLVLEPQVILTQWQPRRPFQGWRYLQAADVPADMGDDSGMDELPETLRRELTELGLL